jgi:molybdenum cofactor guanylyltransferase
MRIGAGIDVVVLAGGRSSRFGSDKLALLLDDVLDGLPADASVVCVGPPRTTRRAGVAWVREDPPFAGPLAGVGAGLAAGSGPVLVLVGGDMPAVGLAIAALLAAVAGAPTSDGAVLVDADGRPQVLASAWRRSRLAAVLAHLAHNWDDSFDLAPPIVHAALVGRPLRLLLERTDLVPVPDEWGAARDVDSAADLP